ncbi:phosphatidylglycerophosphatase A family protein [Syntrophorhabdus aromaticivorans]|uniref:Phosphatidylglycerophosphatase A n=1 Tax=Syntrophorhabdus aromaticivorans TaxID=328301 RepID=A0A351U3N2_9BACT|nr:phosphatidylglycerophosphatase A [Syntrophorhabdus aromaticivorans]NLW34049.1 phosphatidylglycerophosphatase A [Syntrophorhabdus aromaticivorans]HBA54563.1 phosphatidylglycerophosphatase A [Syntrophorhabdus aromaticivorans]
MIERSTAVKDKALLFFLTSGFIGYLPFAPGTYGSAFGCILLYLLPSVFAGVIFVAALTVAAVVAINSLSYEGEDPGYIVMDEVIGMLVTMVGHKVTIPSLAAGFVLFRFFDIVKPFPIKRVEGLPRGYGIVADDILAGIFASLVLFLWGSIRP